MSNGESATRGESAAIGSVLEGGVPGYSSARLPDIPGSLSSLFAELQKDSGIYSRAASTNVLIPVGSPEATRQAEELIEEVARFHPSRFFVYGVNRNLSGIRAEVSARCHFTSKGGGKSQHVCSEIVRLGTPVALTQATPATPATSVTKASPVTAAGTSASQAGLGPRGDDESREISSEVIRAVAQVVRANLVTGTPTEMLLLDAEISEGLMAIASPLADQLIFDSGMWAHRAEVLPKILGPVRRSVDLQWISLAAWRSMVKVMFDVPLVQGLGAGMQRITMVIDPVEGVPGRVPMRAWLCAGWLAHRLRLKVVGRREGVCDFVSEVGAPVRLTLSLSEEPPTVESRWLAGPDLPVGGVRSLRFEGTARGGRGIVVEIERVAGLLEGRVRGERPVVITRPADSDSNAGLLRRYFLVGESTANYFSSMQVALRLLLGRTPEGVVG